MTSFSEQNSLVSICIVSYNCASVIDACLITIPAECPVHIIDNGSYDNGINVALKIRPDAIIEDNNQNIGFGAGHNRLLKKVTTPFALLLNPDAELLPDTVQQLIQTAYANPQASIIGGMHIDENSKQESCFKPFELDLKNTKSVEMVSGGLMLLRMDAFNGSFFDENIFLYYEDDDICHQTRLKGWEVLIEPRAHYHHAVSHSTGNSLHGAWFKGYHMAKSHYYTQNKNGRFKSSSGKAFAFRLICRKAKHLLIKLVTFRMAHVSRMWGEICGYYEATIK